VAIGVIMEAAIWNDLVLDSELPVWQLCSYCLGDVAFSNNLDNFLNPNYFFHDFWRCLFQKLTMCVERQASVKRMPLPHHLGDQQYADVVAASVVAIVALALASASALVLASASVLSTDLKGELCSTALCQLSRWRARLCLPVL